MLNVGCGFDEKGDVRVDICRGSSATLMADAQNLPFQDEVFDEVQSISVLEHIPDWRKALLEILRVSRRKVFLEVPVNSDIRFTDVFRLLLPTPGNIRLFFSIPERARETVWQFDPKIMYRFLLKNGWLAYWSKVIQFYAGMPSRCWRFHVYRIRELIRKE